MAHISMWLFCFVTFSCLYLGSVSAQCREGWYYEEGSCYGFGEAPLTWGDAEEVCKVHSAKLVEIETAEENIFVKQMARNKNIDTAWLGGTDILDEGNWEWVTTGERIMAFTDWHQGQPDEAGSGEDCLQIRKDQNYEWNDLDCHLTSYFICEAEPSETIIGR